MRRSNIMLMVLIMTFSVNLHAQKIKTKKRVEKQKGYLEEYYVLKEDKTTKHGPYKKLTYGKRLLEKGQYKQGLKAGSWIIFYKNGKRRIDAEYYEGNPSGKWKYYSLDGSIDQIYNHDDKKVDFNREITPIEYLVKSGKNYVRTILDDPPYLIGGFSTLTYYISENIIYPRKEREKNISGTVKISFIVLKDGTIADYEIEKSLSKGCDKEAMRVIKLIPNEWIPGIYNGEATDVKVVIPIVFKLNNMSDY